MHRTLVHLLVACLASMAIIAVTDREPVETTTVTNDVDIEVHNEVTYNYTTVAPAEPVVVEVDPPETLTVDEEMDKLHDDLEDSFSQALEAWGI